MFRLLLAASLLLTGCQWIEPPPDMLAESYHEGAVHGCMRAVVNMYGSPSTEKEIESVRVFCYYAADEAQQILERFKAEEQALPTRVPGSEL